MLLVRSATAADYADFLRLFAELGAPDPTPSEAQFAELVPRMYVATGEPGVIGYSTWRTYGTAAHVVHLAVDRAERGRGVGRALMDRVREAALAGGCTRWLLNVKRDNASAIRLYERCGLRHAFDSWTLRIPWERADALPVDRGVVASGVEPADDAAIAERFGLIAERLAMQRARATTVLIALREGADAAGFAAFDVAFPGAYPFCVARPVLAGALLAAMRAHARHDYVRMTVDRDWALVDALRDAGAELVLGLMQMAGPLVGAPLRSGSDPSGASR